MSSCGHDHHGAECDHDEEDPEGQTLYGFIDTEKIRCLNESVAGAGVNPIKPYAQRMEPEPRLDSHDDDPELILYIPFTRVVKVKSICVIGGHGGEGTSPAQIKLFVNREDVDFSNCQDLPPAQQVELADDRGEHGARGGFDYPLKLSKFQSVSSLTIFFSENFRGAFTSISYLGFKGEVTTARHGIVECVYESASQVADHKTKADSNVPDVAGN